MKKSSEKTKVSIIIPTYNSGGTLVECLQSICSQSYPFFEVIVVDNFSNDNTLKIAESFGAKMVRKKCNPASARNIGLAMSTGEYILFLDSDQILSSTLIEECAKLCDSENVGMIKIPEVFIGRNFWGSCSATWKNCYQNTEQSKSERIINGEPRFFTKTDLVQAGAFDDNLLWGEDYDLYKRMIKLNIKGIQCKSKIYHLEPKSISVIFFKMQRYGEFMPIFTRRTQERIFPSLISRSLSTLKKIVIQHKKHPAVIMGCTLLLFLKTYSLTTGVFLGLILKKGGP